MTGSFWKVAAITGALIIGIGLFALVVIPKPTAAPSTDYYEDVASWQAYEGSGFSLSYPLDFETNEIHDTPSTEWRMDANGSTGSLLFTLTIPKAFQPQTNFSEAKLTVGESSNTKAIAECMTPNPSGATVPEPKTTVIHGNTFTVFRMSDAGAGNLYDTTSYRTVHEGKCYAIEYTIHSTQLANYPESYNLKPFDKAEVSDVLDRIISTVIVK